VIGPKGDPNSVRKEASILKTADHVPFRTDSLTDEVHDAMELLYHSDSFVVVRFDVPAEPPGTVGRGGYEIVDKFARKEIFLEGLLAESFKAGVEQLAEQEPSVEEFDAYIARFSALAQQPVAMH
jgi:hypothetical protein